MASWTIQARIVVDGRTSTSRRDSLASEGSRRLGPARWTEVVEEARHEMHRQLLDRSVHRAVDRAARVRTRDGRAHSVADLTGGRATVVIFWSRNCGYSLEALPEIAALVSRLTSDGTPFMFVVDESPSLSLDAFLKGRGVTWPVYFDVNASLADAMRNFGTPKYYVLDRDGDIRFARVDEVSDLYGQVAAIEEEALSLGGS